MVAPAPAPVPMSSTSTTITLSGSNITYPLTAAEQAALMAALNDTIGQYPGVSYSLGGTQVGASTRTNKVPDPVLLDASGSLCRH